MNILSRNYLLTIYKSFIRSHLDYWDIIYDQPNSESFRNKIEPLQCYASLAITGVMKGTSHVRLYKELYLESLRFRRWLRQHFTFFKIKASGKRDYLLNLNFTDQHSYNTWRLDEVKTYYCRTDTFENSFLFFFLFFCTQ